MRDRLKQAARLTLKVAAVAVDPLFGSYSGPRILIYHQVGVNLGREMDISTDSFVEQLDWIQMNGEIVDLETAIRRRDESDADELFVLTFDDGFEDVYSNAFPLMTERRIPFTLYLTTGPIETGSPLDPRYPAAAPLTWDQVKEMLDSGLATIGAHTHTHPDLRYLPREEIAEELNGSNRLILERTGVAPKHFTYPWGWWSETAESLVRETYLSSTIGEQKTTLVADGPYLMGRLPVQRSDSLGSFASRMKHGLRLEEWVRSVVSGHRR